MAKSGNIADLDLDTPYHSKQRVQAATYYGGFSSSMSNKKKNIN
jgi:hypothetical protein